jgi:hypothetical protein
MLISCSNNLSSMFLKNKQKGVPTKHLMQSKTIVPITVWHKTAESCSQVIQHVPTNQSCFLLHKNINSVICHMSYACHLEQITLLTNFLIRRVSCYIWDITHHVYLPWHCQAQGSMAEKEYRLVSVCGGRLASHCCASPEPNLQAACQSDCVLFLSKYIRITL